MQYVNFFIYFCRKNTYIAKKMAESAIITGQYVRLQLLHHHHRRDTPVLHPPHGNIQPGTVHRQDDYEYAGGET